MPPEETGAEALERLRREFWEWAGEVMGLTPEFFQQLEIDDDWAFLIKWHAVLETCVNRLLTRHFQNPLLAPIFAYLDMSGSKAGKMTFAVASKLLLREHREFIRRFSEMRNHAVHDIKNFGFTFREYVDDFKKEERNSLIRQLGLAYPRESMIGGRKVTAESITEGYPRGAIALSCRMIVAEVFVWEKSAGNESELAKIRLQLAPHIALQFWPTPAVPNPTEPPSESQS